MASHWHEATLDEVITALLMAGLRGTRAQFMVAGGGGKYGPVADAYVLLDGEFVPIEIGTMPIDKWGNGRVVRVYYDGGVSILRASGTADEMRALQAMWAIGIEPKPERAGRLPAPVEADEDYQTAPRVEAAAGGAAGGLMHGRACRRCGQRFKPGIEYARHYAACSPVQ